MVGDFLWLVVVLAAITVSVLVWLGWVLYHEDRGAKQWPPPPSNWPELPRKDDCKDKDNCPWESKKWTK